MKLRRIHIIILIGCMILIGVGSAEYGVTVQGRKDERTLLENCFIQIDSEDDLSGKRIETPKCNPGIYYAETLLPYDNTKSRLYLPQNFETPGWYGKMTAIIDGENYPLYILRDEMLEKKREAIRESHDFTIYVQISDEEYYRFLLTITGIPLISMSTEYEEEAEEISYEEDPDKYVYGSETKYYGEFLMIDPGGRSGQYQITEAALCYHYKGASTRGAEKKSYSIELLDYRGEKVNVSLAGMRSGSKWKLNSLYTDANRVREITASQIWELIDEANDDINESGPNMEYTELIVDNEYKGVYCLVEPIDAKKMKLQEYDVLYKVIDWNIPSGEDYQEFLDRGWRVQYPVRIRYPKDIKNYEAAWHPMNDYLNMFYRGGIIQYEEAVKHIDLDNYCDMLIFIMVVSGSDNYYKNTYYVAECGDGAQNYRLKQIPWDLDYTFGNIYRYGVDRSVEFNDDYQITYLEAALPRLYGENPKEIGDRLNERWESYRNDFLKTECINDLFEENRDYLLESGVFVRETERWPEGGVDMDIACLKEFQKNRMDWLDSYFELWIVD